MFKFRVLQFGYIFLFLQRQVKERYFRKFESRRLLRLSFFMI